MAEENYASDLDSYSLEKARVELFETPEKRLGSVQALKDWAMQQPWLKTPTDTHFLLSILRARKFSQLGARELLVNYWTKQMESPEWFVGADPGSEESLQILRAGPTIVPLAGRDKCGRRILLFKVGNLDTSEKYYNTTSYIRTFHFLGDRLLLEEKTQVNGIVLMADFMNVSLKQQLWLGIDNLRKVLKYLQKSVPVRLKELHFFNLGPFFDAIFVTIKSFLSQKLQSRVFVHSRGLVTVYKHVDMSMLPVEYLPDEYQGPLAGTLQDIMEKFILEEYLDRKSLLFIQELHSGRYGVDLSIKPKTGDEMVASFRKLSVD
ncbi:hypothetical protein CHS0354_000042 [Potamilus streckersoni]|uniref:CRAL-TRIO domain-containing protein n=1 Tax=Potamilus streckersoni TaxID=2493646 RepID=A0AAE0WA27_9BIVA|nr:hypothetical protein CHS0354_000042 [Potamilus streckersoni]